MMSFWDIVSVGYDLVERLINRKVYNNTGTRVAQEVCPGDDVLECACGTGSITVHLAAAGRTVRATDFSVGMLRKCRKNTRQFDNVRLCRADITALRCRDEVFDKVVAGNVIHLLDEPYKALDELMRVCKKGGKVIIPTYINLSGGSIGFLAKVFDVLGADFKRQFDLESYKRFFADGGYRDVQFDVVSGRMPCAIAVITKE